MIWNRLEIENNKMTWDRVIVLVILCVIKLKADSPRDIDYYYLDTVGSQPKEIIPQDGQDAQAIIDSKKDPKIVAKILLQRDKIRRININKEITNKDKKNPLLPDKYEPLKIPINDLYFTLVSDESTVLSEYLHNFFYLDCPEHWITIAFALTKDWKTLEETYNKKFGDHTFKYGRKSQIEGYENMLRVWVRDNREANEKELKPDLIQKDVDALIEEYKKSGWHGGRDQLELILMRKSIKYAREVIKGFEKAYDNCPMEQIINDCTNTHDLQPQLAYAYATLARYIKNRNQYISDILREHSEGRDFWAAWMLSISVTFPEEWIQIDHSFRNSGNKDISLSKFITERMAVPEKRNFVSIISQIVDVTNKGPSKQPTNAVPAAPQPSPPTSQPPPG